MKRYKIESYQAVYSDGRRDSAKLLVQQIVTDIEAYRAEKKIEKQCMSVNLVYMEIEDKNELEEDFL